MKTKHLKPFDLQAALRGEPVMLRGGRKAYVRHNETEQAISKYGQLWGVGSSKRGGTRILLWSKDGLYDVDECENELDIIGMWPKTRIINGFEVPAPETTKPDCGTTYFTSSVDLMDMVGCQEWDNDAFDACMLERGIVFLSAEDAIANAKAMLGIDPHEESE